MVQTDRQVRFPDPGAEDVREFLTYMEQKVRPWLGPLYVARWFWSLFLVSASRNNKNAHAKICQNGKPSVFRPKGEICLLQRSSNCNCNCNASLPLVP